MRPQDLQVDAALGPRADANPKLITMKIVLSRNFISKYEMIDALMNQSLIARLSGTPHLALLTEESTRDNFALQDYIQEVTRSPGSIKVRFHQDHLRDPVTGEYKFCDLIPAVFTMPTIDLLNVQRRRFLSGHDHPTNPLQCAQDVQSPLPQGRHCTSSHSKLSSRRCLQVVLEVPRRGEKHRASHREGTPFPNPSKSMASK